MKTKELKNLAIKIAKCEKIIRDSKDSKSVYKAQQTIEEISNSIETFEDLVTLDEMVMTILEKI